jgi:hypothetical protein
MPKPYYLFFKLKINHSINITAEYIEITRIQVVSFIGFLIFIMERIKNNGAFATIKITTVINKIIGNSSKKNESEMEEKDLKKFILKLPLFNNPK